MVIIFWWQSWMLRTQGLVTRMRCEFVLENLKAADFSDLGGFGLGLEVTSYSLHESNQVARQLVLCW